LLFISSSLHAANPPHVRFNHLTIDDGLSQNLVYCIFQDSKGFMWFGTKDGLNMYDGYRFTVFRHNPYDSTSISDSDVYSIFEDHAGRLWIGGNSLNLFDRETETFQHIKHRPGDPQSLSPGQVWTIQEDQNGALWIGTRGGGVSRVVWKTAPAQAGGGGPDVFRVRTESGMGLITASITRLTRDPASPHSLNNDYVHRLYVDSKNRLWVGTINGLNVLDLNGFDGEQSHFTRYAVHSDDPVAAVTAICEDRNGTIWLSTRYGLVRTDEKGTTPEFQTYPFEKFYEWASAIIEDDDGKLWVTTNTHLSVFDPQLQKHVTVIHDPGDPQSLSHFQLISLLKDRSGNIWIGTSGKGINVYAPRLNRFSNYRGDPDVFGTASVSTRSVIEAPDGHLWFLTSRGEVCELDQETGVVVLHPREGAFPSSRNGIVRGRDGTIWVSTLSAVVAYDPVSSSQLVYPIRALAVYEDRDGTIWVANRQNLARLDRASGEFAKYSLSHSDVWKSTEREGFALYRDNHGVFWIGGQEGLLRYDPASSAANHYRTNPDDTLSLNSHTVWSILPDPDQPERYLWLGTNGGGLNLFAMETETFLHFTDREGLPNNVVYGVIPDDQGYLWMSTNLGLSRVRFQFSHDGTVRIASVKNFDAQDGLQSNEFNHLSYGKGRSGKLYFGGVNGISSFYPSLLEENPHVPPMALTDIQVSYKSIDHRAPGSPLLRSIGETRSIEFPYSANVLSITYTALDFTAPEKNLYAYTMENLDDEWNYVGAVRTANYTNIPPGDYVFRVRGSNNDGVWNETGASIQITIAPPFWLTWWAYILYALITVGVLYSVRRYELNRLRLKGLLARETSQTERFKELDALKSRFFANISHEFRTPLTLILGPAEAMLEEAKDEQSRQWLGTVRANAKRLLSLVNQLLDLSRLEGGTVHIRAVRGDIVAFVREIVGTFMSYCDQKEITLDYSSQVEQLLVYFDRDMMEKVCANLLNNAVKFTPSGGSVIVAINVKDGSVHIGVTDTGRGIPAESIPYIFDRFYQVDSSTQREYEGTGIGLALVSDLVEIHHGTISVESEFGRGTTFTVHLPLGREHLEDEEIIPATHAETKSISSFVDESDEPKAQSRERVPAEDETIVLVVEDKSDMRAYIRRCLEQDYTVLEAANGLDGWIQARESIPDLIVSDLMMPQMDGLELCRSLKTDEKTSHIPVILITARAGQQDRLEGLETGADEYLVKPFDSRELLIRSGNLIAIRRALRLRFSQALVLKPSAVTATPMEKAFLEKALAAVEQHMALEDFGVENLGAKLGMSRSQLHRKLRALTNQSPTLFIRAIRLQRGADLLRQNAATVAEIAYAVGFGSQAYFSTCFREQFGCTPKEYVHRHTPQNH
jgi:signal transduction histidine kinase/ligand-binding sensor domain-containing protein/AraC-like DNA-binding protein